MGLREQAALDGKAILEDVSGFAWPLTLTSPAGVVTALRGFTTDVGQTIDPDTGQAVAGRRASATVSRASLPALPEAVADRGRKPWIATFADSQGANQQWKVIEVLPDAALGVVVLLLELYALATVKLTGALQLPQIQLAGSLAPVISGALTLPQLQLAGSTSDFDPSQVPQIAAGEYWLPGVGVSGTTTVNWVGRNGTNTLSRTPAANVPDPSVGPGGFPDWTWVAANVDAFIQSSPAGPLQATDGLYLAIWFRYDSLDTVNRVIAEQYGLAGQRKWHIRKTASTNVLQIEWSDDGTNVLSCNAALTEAEGVGTVSQLDKYLFLELLIDPLQVVPSNKVRAWLEMIPIPLGGFSGSGGASLANAGTFRIGANNFENQIFNGRIGPTYVGRRVGGVILPTDEQRRGIWHFKAPKQQRIQVVVDGNSLTQGQGASVPSVTSYPGVLRAALNSRGIPTRDLHDRGLGGQTTEQMLAGFPTRVAPFYDPFFRFNVLVWFEIRNSSVAGRTPSEIIATHQAYSAAARAAGFLSVVCTAPPTDGDAVGHGTPGAVNAWLRANWQTIADGFVDLELVPEYTPAGDIANPTYYIDGVHMKDPGYAKMEEKVLAELQARGWAPSP